MSRFDRERNHTHLKTENYEHTLKKKKRTGYVDVVSLTTRIHVTHISNIWNQIQRPDEKRVFFFCVYVFLNLIKRKNANGFQVLMSKSEHAR